MGILRWAKYNRNYSGTNQFFRKTWTSRNRTTQITLKSPFRVLQKSQDIRRTNYRRHIIFHLDNASSDIYTQTIDFMNYLLFFFHFPASETNWKVYVFRYLKKRINVQTTCFGYTLIRVAKCFKCLKVYRYSWGLFWKTMKWFWLLIFVFVFQFRNMEATLVYFLSSRVWDDSSEYEMSKKWTAFNRRVGIFMSGEYDPFFISRIWKTFIRFQYDESTLKLAALVWRNILAINIWKADISEVCRHV